MPHEIINVKSMLHMTSELLGGRKELLLYIYVKFIKKCSIIFRNKIATKCLVAFLKKYCTYNWLTSFIFYDDYMPRIERRSFEVMGRYERPIFGQTFGLWFKCSPSARQGIQLLDRRRIYVMVEAARSR